MNTRRHGGIGLGSLPELEDDHAVAAQRGGAEELVKGLPHQPAPVADGQAIRRWFPA